MHFSHDEAFNRSWVAGRNEDVPRSRRQFQRFDCEIESITVFEGARLQSDGPWERTDVARFVCARRVDAVLCRSARAVPPAPSGETDTRIAPAGH